MTEVWKLEITDDNGVVQRVCGSQEVLTRAMDEWEAAAVAPDGTGSKLLKVHGFCDTSDRAEIILACKIEMIRHACLTRLY